jgi:hypothetical protein
MNYAFLLASDNSIWKCIRTNPRRFGLKRRKERKKEKVVGSFSSFLSFLPSLSFFPSFLLLETTLNSAVFEDIFILLFPFLITLFTAWKKKERKENGSARISRCASFGLAQCRGSLQQSCSCMISLLFNVLLCPLSPLSPSCF